MSSITAPSIPHHSSTSPPVSSSNGLPQVPPSNSQIEAVIQMATSTASPDSRTPGRDTRTQLFVGNLPYRVRWQDLKDLFRQAGTVLRADVSLGSDNRSRGYGTVLLATAEDAARAVEMFNGYNWQTRTLEVRPDRSPPDFEKPNHMPIPNLNALPSSAVPAVPLPLPPPPSYVPPLADHPMIGMDDFETSKLVGIDRTRVPSIAGFRNLFVGNLPFHCQWQDLKDLFRQAGTIVRADVALGPDGRSRGFGTVSFVNDSDAERALNIFNGYEYNGRTLKVHYDRYSQGQPSQSPIPPHSVPTSTSPPLHHTHANAPTHIAMPAPPPLAAFESLASGHQSPSKFDNPFGQISPYDLYPPHIAAIAANATAQAYMKSQLHSSAAITPSVDHFTAVSMSAPSAVLPSSESEMCSSTPDSKSTHPTSSAPLPSTHKSAPIPSSSAHNHPHPGPISLPSPSINSFPHIPGPVSPAQGLPPITPSMPSFTFVPHNITPPLSAHFLSPGVGLSPFSPTGSMSPGAFYGPPQSLRHPLGQVWNAAPGAPLHAHSPVGSPSPGYYAMSAQSSTEGGVGLGMNDYFSVQPQTTHVVEGYFLPVSVVKGSGDSNEVSKEGKSVDVGNGASLSDAEQKTDESVLATDGSSLPSDSRLGEGHGCGGRSSVETSLDGEELGLEVRKAVESFDALSLRDYGTKPPVVPVPHRTHSDGADATIPLAPRISDRQPSEEVVCEQTLDTPERRASWTPEASRNEFRRGLPT